ncbi:MAG: LLM class flavin-dependent oxidoreductase [Acidimicrobiia bacterium]|nr:LLM class flavin-dependent oxidoreductase [Acidimicrobiia bacterium]
MRLGISINSTHPDVAPEVAVANVLERARTAAAAGLDHLTLGDLHAAGPNSNYVQNVPMIGRILAEWPSDRSIGLLFVLPLWHPVLAAEQVGTLAALLGPGAPFIVQTGVGGRPNEFAAMGAELTTRGRRTDEAIRVMKALLAGERVHSETFTISGAAIAPRPPIPVEWWIGSGLGDRPLQRAAREGDAWYVGPGATPADLAAAMPRYCEMCTRFGTLPRIAVRRDILVTDDDAIGLARGRELIAAGYRGLTEEQLIFGGVDRVAEAIAVLADIGAAHDSDIDVVVRTMAVDQPTAVRSIELLADVRTRLP